MKNGKRRILSESSYERIAAQRKRGGGKDGDDGDHTGDTVTEFHSFK